MSRDYEKEREWSKNKYVRILGDIDKDLAEKLKSKLKEENKSIASWITENAVKCLDMKKVYSIVDIPSQKEIMFFNDCMEMINYFRSSEYELFLSTHNKDNFIIDITYKKEVD